MCIMIQSSGVTENFVLGPRGAYAGAGGRRAGEGEWNADAIGEEDKSAGMGVQVIARAASVLRALEGKPEGLSLAQIAREVGLARSTVQRIVAASQRKGS